MQGQAQQQAYDRGITIFSPDGRLYQVEYAREAVKRGTASIGVRTTDGVVLAVDKRVPSPLLEDSSVEKIHKADDHIGIASAGHVADARQLIDFARRQTQVNQLRYGEPIGVETLTKEVTDHIQQYTQVGGARPFGVALIVGGIETGAAPVRDRSLGDALRVEGAGRRCRPERTPGVSGELRRGSRQTAESRSPSTRSRRSTTARCSRVKSDSRPSTPKRSRSNSSTRIGSAST